MVGVVRIAVRSVRFEVDVVRIEGRFVGFVGFGFDVAGFMMFHLGIGRFVGFAVDEGGFERLGVVHGRLLVNGFGFVGGHVGFLRVDVVRRLVGLGLVEFGGRLVARRRRRVVRLGFVVEAHRVGFVLAAAAALAAAGRQERVEGVVTADDVVDGRLADALGEDRVGIGQTRAQRRGQHHAHQLALHAATSSNSWSSIQSSFVEFDLLFIDKKLVPFFAQRSAFAVKSSTFF